MFPDETVILPGFLVVGLLFGCSVELMEIINAPDQALVYVITCRGSTRVVEQVTVACDVSDPRGLVSAVPFILLVKSDYR